MLATMQSLMLCSGREIIKPDAHIKKAFIELSLENKVQVCELISELTGIS
jgi:hypothetical protein